MTAAATLLARQGSRSISASSFRSTTNLFYLLSARSFQSQSGGLACSRGTAVLPLSAPVLRKGFCTSPKHKAATATTMTSEKAEGVTIERHGSYGIISIAFEPVNAWSRPAWQSILDALTTLESDPECHGVILRSGLRKRNVFSAGVALTEFYAPETDEASFTSFWELFNSVIGRVYASRLITVAAVNGFSPAGGTGLTLGCDIRIATQDVSLGLNEVALGIPVPRTWTKMMAARIGQGKAADLCVFAKPVRADEALACGLVHQVVPEDSGLMQVAQERIEAALKLPQAARTRTKSYFTDDLAVQMLDMQYLKSEAAEYWQAFSSETTTGLIGKMLKRPPVKGKL